MRTQETITETSWPKHTVKTIECRKRDIVIRIADWSRQSAETGEPAYDVEVYVHGVYDFNLSKTCALHKYGTETAARRAAAEFAAKRIAELLKVGK